MWDIKSLRGVHGGGSSFFQQGMGMIGTTRRPLCSSAAVCLDFLFLDVLFLFLPMASYVKISFFRKRELATISRTYATQG